MTPIGCKEFSPHSKDASWCVCNVHWNHHPPYARKAFFDHSAKDIIQMVISACMKDNKSPCGGYKPSRNWDKGTPAPECVCGRPAKPSHSPGSLLKGMKEFRAANALPVCGRHIGSITTPGICSVCQHKWIEHAPANRGLIIEAFEDLHEPSCKCVIMNGDVECSCMTDTEIQAKLDKLGQKETKVSCRQFTSKSTGNTTCTCGDSFWMHSDQSRDGENVFAKWRASHMTNKELIAWFQALPGLGIRGERLDTGATRNEKARFLEHLLSDPYAKYTPPFDQVNPSELAMLALLETIDGGAVHRVKQKKASDTVDATSILVKEDEPANNPPRKYFCHSCQQMESDTPGTFCEDCRNYGMTHSAVAGPVLHNSSDDKGGS